MQFNETLAKLRKEHGYTQEQIAEKLSVSRQAVARWEAGETAPDVYILQKLSEIFGVSADEILNGENTAPAVVEFSPAIETESPCEEVQTGAAAKPKEHMPPTVKLIFAAVIVVILSAVLAINIGIISFALISKSAGDSMNIKHAPALTSISYTAGFNFWTAEEYEKWAEEQLEYYREMYESGEKLLFHMENGDEEYRALTEDDIKSIKKSLDETLSAIIDGGLYTKDEVINWTGPDGQEYSVISAETFVIDDSESFDTSTQISDMFLTFDGNVAVTVGNSEQSGLTLKERFSQYEEYGLEYEEKDGQKRLYFNGTPVDKFLDISPDGGIFVFCSDGGGEISVQVDYDEDGNLLGIKTVRPN